MPAKGYWEKAKTGVYRSRDGRAEIQKQISRQTRRPDEVCWRVIVDGRTQVMHEDTLREAKAVAVKLTGHS